MSWLFSRALVEAYLPGICSDGERFVLWSSMPTARPFWLRDKMMKRCPFSRFGLTYKHLTEDHGEALLKWFREVFLVKTSPPAESEPVSTGKSQGSGLKCCESSEKWHQLTFSSKILKTSGPRDFAKSSKGLPRSGSMTNGIVSARKRPELPTLKECVFGNALPTLTVCQRNNSGGAKKGPVRLSLQNLLPTIRANRTLRATDANRGGKNANNKHGDLIVGGPLNPTWTEWFMGFPLGWTALEPLEMHKFRQWQNSHGKDCSDGS
jgi:hypothetical protein